ncbi:MAG: hypothetical protein RTV41_09375 [Candidatus Thorarchaeota archaeon]
MSKKKSTKSTAAAFIKPDGVSLSVRLFYLTDMAMSANQLVKFMKSKPFAISDEKPVEGFTKVKERGNTVSCEFIMSFTIPRYTFTKGKLIELDTPTFSVKRGTIVVKIDREFVEIRGSDRLAARFRTLLRREEVARMTPLSVTKQARTVFDEIKRRDKANISYVLLTDMDETKIAFTHAEFKGNNIQNASEINLYQQRFNGNIARFSGVIPYSSTKKAMKTTVNFKGGAMTIFPFDSKGVSPRDLRWLVTMLENNADPPPSPAA